MFHLLNCTSVSLADTEATVSSLDCMIEFQPFWECGCLSSSQGDVGQGTRAHKTAGNLAKLEPGSSGLGLRSWHCVLGQDTFSNTPAMYYHPIHGGVVTLVVA